MLVLVLLGVTFVTLSQRSGNSGVFAKARAYANDVANPFQSAVHSALEPVGNFLYGAAHYGSLEKENQLLRQDLAIFDFELSGEDVEAISALNRNERTGPDPDKFDMLPN